MGCGVMLSPASAVRGARQDAGVEREEDHELVRGAQAGDAAAFEELVRRHAGRLHEFVRRFAGTRQEAEEVTQEAFLRAWRGIGRFHGDASFSTWLFRIGVNESRRRRQIEQRFAHQVPLDGQLVEPRETRPGPALVAQHHDLKAALERAIAELPPELREPLVLRDVEGLTTEQAAAVMELGEAAFKSRLHRARLVVRAAVHVYLPDETDR